MRGSGQTHQATRMQTMGNDPGGDLGARAGEFRESVHLCAPDGRERGDQRCKIGPGLSGLRLEHIKVL